MKNGFTLIEMLVVIGIIAILIAASLGGYSSMTKSAEKARAQELVSNVATALSALYQENGVWPKRLRDGMKSKGQLDETAAYALKGHFSLTTSGTKLAGLDRLGIVTPWAAAVVKRKGTSASLSDKVTANSTVQDHILHYAIDLDGDGIISDVDVGGEKIDVRATAIVWSIGKSGGDNGKPWPYSKAQRHDDVYSWTRGQTQNVK